MEPRPRTGRPDGMAATLGRLHFVVVTAVILASACSGPASSSATSPGTGVVGRVTAGPTCPVEIPGDPACAPRPVADAVLIVEGAGGTEVGRLVTDESGFFRLALQPGDYTLEPQPVDGLMGTPAATSFTVIDGDEAQLDVAYDTGIR